MKPSEMQIYTTDDFAHHSAAVLSFHSAMLSLLGFNFGVFYDPGFQEDHI